MSDIRRQFNKPKIEKRLLRTNIQLVRKHTKNSIFKVKNKTIPRSCKRDNQPWFLRHQCPFPRTVSGKAYRIFDLHWFRSACTAICHGTRDFGVGWYECDLAWRWCRNQRTGPTQPPFLAILSRWATGQHSHVIVFPWTACSNCNNAMSPEPRSSRFLCHSLLRQPRCIPRHV